MVFFGVKSCQFAVEKAGGSDQRAVAESAADGIDGMLQRFLRSRLFIGVVKKSKLDMVDFSYEIDAADTDTPKRAQPMIIGEE